MAASEYDGYTFYGIADEDEMMIDEEWFEQHFDLLDIHPLDCDDYTSQVGYGVCLNTDAKGFPIPPSPKVQEQLDNLLETLKEYHGNDYSFEMLTGFCSTNCIEYDNCERYIPQFVQKKEEEIIQDQNQEENETLEEKINRLVEARVNEILKEKGLI